MKTVLVASSLRIVPCIESAASAMLHFLSSADDGSAEREVTKIKDLCSMLGDSVFV